MAGPSGSGASFRPGLVGRRRDCDRLAALLSSVRSGRGEVLVLRGEAGIGRTALLEFLVDRAAGCRVDRAAGVAAEADLAYAGLHQLCGPHLDRLDALPARQRDALGTAFGLWPGPGPDRFLVGLAVLTLLNAVAADGPVLWVVDDAQWLDRASVRTLEFVARRLAADPVGLVLAVRTPEDEPVLAGLPEHVVAGLGSADAGTLLDASVTGALDPRVRSRLLAESLGNPLVLLELSRGLSAAELAFGVTTAADAGPQAHRLERGFLRRLEALPAPARQLLLAAAAEPVGDVPLLWRAAERLGIDAGAAATAEAAGLVEVRDRVRFRHPLVRPAVYRSATPAERRAVHRALAEVTDPGVDPDRRAWHLARAAAGPDEAVAAELERSAGRALSSGGVAAAAAFLEQAAALTPDRARRAGRLLAGAQASVHAGALDDARALVAAARAGPLDDTAVARADALDAQLALAAKGDDDALPLLLAAARRLEPLDAGLARDTYLDALRAALGAGRLGPGPGAREVARAAREAPRPAAPGPRDALLDGLAVLVTDGYAPAAPLCRRAVGAFAAGEPAVDEAVRFGWLAAVAAAALWDDACWDLLTRRHLELARRAGAVGALPLALHSGAVVRLFTGDLAAAAALVREARSVADSTRNALPPYGEVGLAAVRGRPEEAEPLIRRCLDDGAGSTVAHWAQAVLCNGLGRHRDAVPAAREATADPCWPGPPQWALGELVEAAARSGRTRTAEAALEQLSALARTGGTDWALGVEASRRAVLRAGAAAEELHREALERLGRTRLRVELARARLLYGEWLRQEDRREDARAQLRTAYEAFTAMGVDAFADRARRELLGTGESVRRPAAGASAGLTEQEARIARLVADGLTNPEIGAALYLSPRTVEWHLRKIFAKLEVTSRRQLRLAVRDLTST